MCQLNGHHYNRRIVYKQFLPTIMYLLLFLPSVFLWVDIAQIWEQLHLHKYKMATVCSYSFIVGMHACTHKRTYLYWMSIQLVSDRIGVVLTVCGFDWIGFDAHNLISWLLGSIYISCMGSFAANLQGLPALFIVFVSLCSFTVFYLVCCVAWAGTCPNDGHCSRTRGRTWYVHVLLSQAPCVCVCVRVCMHGRM